MVRDGDEGGGLLSLRSTEQEGGNCLWCLPKSLHVHWSDLSLLLQCR
jgi:hypothetical protein